MTSGMKRPRRVTIKDIAEKAGVSKTTVSLVLQNSPLITKETADIVRSVSDSLGYVYNRTAANLRTQRSSIVGVIISDIGNIFFSELLMAIENTLEGEGVVVMMANTAESPERQRRAISTLLEHNVDGLFISPAIGSTADDLGPLVRSSVPSVFVNRYLPDFPCNYVGTDNVAGVSMAVTRLLSAGHRRIAFLGGEKGSSAWVERMEGYKRAHEPFGIDPDPALTITAPGKRRGGYNAVREVLNRENPPTAAFCYNDIIALGVLLGLESKGIQPGTEFGVFGYDDISESQFSFPPLSTVSSPPDVIGKRACRYLLDKLENGGDLERILVVPQLVVRESCGTA